MCRRFLLHQKRFSLRRCIRHDFCFIKKGLLFIRNDFQSHFRCLRSDFIFIRSDFLYFRGDLRSIRSHFLFLRNDFHFFRSNFLFIRCNFFLVKENLSFMRKYFLSPISLHEKGRLIFFLYTRKAGFSNGSTQERKCTPISVHEERRG